MRAPLTDKQKALFDFFCAFEDAKQRPPSLSEIARGKVNDEQVIPPFATRTSPWATLNQLRTKGYVKEILATDRRTYLVSQREAAE